MSSALYTALPTGDSQYPPPRPFGRPPWRAHKRRSTALPSKRLTALLFYGAAILTGFVLHLLLVGQYIFEGSQNIKHLSPFESAVNATHPRPGAYIPPDSYVRPGLGQLVSLRETRDIEVLRDTVSRTKGFFTRDYSVLAWLGNNVRSPPTQSSSLSSSHSSPNFTRLDVVYYRDGCTARSAPPPNSPLATSVPRTPSW